MFTFKKIYSQLAKTFQRRMFSATINITRKECLSQTNYHSSPISSPEERMLALPTKQKHGRIGLLALQHATVN